VVAVKLGGLDDLPNMLPICSRCNHEKRDKSLFEWVEYLDERGRDYAARMWSIAAWHEWNMLKRVRQGELLLAAE
jgi:hypothetical protein